MLSYSVVVATRNRQAALSLSLPRMVNQSRPPAQIIVVDSSNDHQATACVAKEALRDYKGRSAILKSKPGLVIQRNLALAQVTEPVVFFPDDDSIWHAGVAYEKMRIYELDKENRIAAVCGAEAADPPPGFLELAKESYQMRRGDRIRQALGNLRFRIEHRLAPDPARIMGRRLITSANIPRWLSSENAVAVEWMTGFRMSFRTQAIARTGFDETFSGYSLFEDLDASFAVWQQGLVVGARNARVFHYKSPERREAGLRIGATQVLNKAYVLAKHSNGDRGYLAHMRQFTRFKLVQYGVAARGVFGRQRFLGAFRARTHVAPLFMCPRHQLSGIYTKALNNCLGTSS